MVTVPAGFGAGTGVIGIGTCFVTFCGTGAGAATVMYMGGGVAIHPPTPVASLLLYVVQSGLIIWFGFDGGGVTYDVTVLYCCVGAGRADRPGCGASF